MKVTISFTVDIDPEQWTDDYGTEGAAAIRADVRRYAEHVVRAQLDDVGVLQGSGG